VTLADLVGQFDPDLPLDEASTIPGSWYTDPRIADLERATVWSRTWQLVGRGRRRTDRRRSRR